MMGHYGAAELAGVSGASAVFDLFASIVLASVIGHQILAPRFAGRQDPAGVRESLRSSLMYCGGLTILLTSIVVVYGGWLSGLVTGANAELQHIAARYLVARAATLLLLVPFSLLAATFNAYKQPRFPMIAGIVANAVNLLLDWVLIYGRGGFPRLGEVGNGLATTASWVVGVGWLLVAARRFGLADLLRQSGIRPTVDFTTSIPRLAWPAIVSNGLDYASVAIFFAIIGGIGEAALGGGRIAFEVILLLFAVGGSFAAAARILIGRSAGADRFDEVRVFWRTSQFMLLMPAVAIGSLLAAFPTSAARLFTSFEPVVGAAAEAMTLVAFCVPLMAWTLGNVSTLRALGQTSWDMYGNLVAALCIQLPLAWFLVQGAGLGIAGAYGGVVGYWLARATMTEVLARRLVHQEALTRSPTGPRDGRG